MKSQPINAAKQKKLEIQLENEAAFFNYNPAPVLQVGYDGRVINFNKSAKRLFKKRPRGASIYKILPNLRKKPALHKLIKDTYQIEQPIRKSAFLFTFQNIRDSESIYIYGSEITQRKITEELIRKQNAELTRKAIELAELKSKIEYKNFELEAAYKEITALLQAKTDFMNRAAHDLRTPLTPIVTLIPIIKSDVKDNKLLHSLTIVENNAIYLRELVNELIEFIKTGRNNFEAEAEEVSIKDTIEDVLFNEENVFKENKIKVFKDIGHKLPKLYVNKLRLAEVFSNIIGNSIKFMPNGGGLYVKVFKRNNFIYIKITDTGIGMSKKTLAQLFDAFFKADQSRHTEGAGLGLTICKRIVSRYNGEIYAESPGLGKGSTLTVKLPFSHSSHRGSTYEKTG